MTEDLKKDLKLLRIEETAILTAKFVTAKYKKLTKEKHPDKLGGRKEDFQDLQNAYKRIMEYIEDNEGININDDNFEKDFFMKNNVMKECSTSFVVYLQDKYVENWRIVLGKHVEVHRMDKARYIFKTGIITITLYDKPKKDPRSKLLIQSGDQRVNLEFVLEKLPLFYKEVAKLQSSSVSALELKNMQRSMCPKCNKLFTTKKGVKAHIIRMHGQKIKKTNVNDVRPESLALKSPVPTVSTIVTTPFRTSEVKSPLQKKIRFDDNPSEPEDSREFIQAIVNDVLEQFNSSDTNFQCGDCGITCMTENEINSHMKNDHEESLVFQCQDCAKTFHTEDDLYNHKKDDHVQHPDIMCEDCGQMFPTMEELNVHMRNVHTVVHDLGSEVCRQTGASSYDFQDHTEKDHGKETNGNCEMCENNIMVIKYLQKQLAEKDDKITRLTSKNEAMVKETKRLNLALLESVVENNDAKREIETQRDLMNEILKKNTLLSEEIKVKEDYIKMRDEEKEDVQSNNDEEVVEIEEQASTTPSPSYAEITKRGGEKYKCNGCNYETKVETHLKGHKIAHQGGQYQCLRGCNVAFITLTALDEHIKKKHKEQQEPSGYKCIHCDLSFNELFQVRQHMTKKHRVSLDKSCEKCGLKIPDGNRLDDHMRECYSDFSAVKPQLCKFFMRGNCVKGESCKFTHQETEKTQVPLCRNGQRCTYFSRGICYFYHRGFGTQKPTIKNKNYQDKNVKGRWCNFRDRCNRIPNCPFIHRDQDFPELKKIKTPPLRQEIPAWWKDY